MRKSNITIDCKNSLQYGINKKKKLLKIYFLLFFCHNLIVAQPIINYVSLPGQTTYPAIPNSPSIGQYQKFELDINVKNALTGQDYLNPVFTDEIEVWAIITNLNTGKTYNIGAFFYQNYNKSQPDINSIYSLPYNNPIAYSLNDVYVNSLDFYTYCNNNSTPYSSSGGHPFEKLNKGSHLPIWKIRFAPSEIGNYSFVIYAKDQNGQISSSSTNYRFSCNSSSNKGFIKLANARYLKFDNGDSYFPIGSGIQWYSSVCYLNGNAWGFYSPENYGTIEYETYIEKLALNKANFIRIFLTQEGLGVFGYDYSMDVCFYKNVPFRDPTTDFNSNLQNSYGINLRDAWQLDYIINLCEQKNIKIQLALMNVDQLGANDMNWSNSPYNQNGNFAPLKPNSPFTNAPFTKLTNGCASPYKFFTNTEAISYTKNCLKYLINRYSYSTSIMSWEILNEIVNADFEGDANGTDLTNWVKQMRDYIKSIDPQKHPITCSTGFALYNGTDGGKTNAVIEIAKSMDFTDDHEYFWNGFVDNTYSANKQVYDFAKNFEQFKKPHFITESGSLNPNDMIIGDPIGFSFHSLTWSSSFSGCLGSIINHYTGNMIMKQNYDKNFNGLSVFFSDLKLDEDNNMKYLSNTYTLNQAGLNNYYMMKNNEEIYGWCQDNNFTVEALTANANVNPSNNYLKNLTNRPTLSVGQMPHPAPSELNFDNLEDGEYLTQFFDTQSGNLLNESYSTTYNHHLTVPIPTTFLSAASNKYADIAYKIKKYCGSETCGWNENPHNLNAPLIKLNSSICISSDNSHIFYVDQTDVITNSYYSNNNWTDIYLNSSFIKIKSGSKILTDNQGRVFYISTDSKIRCATYSSSGWQEAIISGNLSVAGNGLCLDASENIFFVSASKIYKCQKSGSTYLAPVTLNTNSVAYSASPDIDIAYSSTYNEIYYAQTPLNKLGVLKLNGSIWNVSMPGNISIKTASKITLDKTLQRVFYVGTNNLIYNTFYSSSIWQTGSLHPTEQCIGNNIEFAADHIFYVGPGNVLYNMIWNPTYGWMAGPLNTCRVANSAQNTSLLYKNDKLYYIDINGKLRYAFWENTVCPQNRMINPLLNEQINENIENHNIGNLKLYPNPASDFFKIEYDNSNLSSYILEISNIYGEIIFKKSFNANNKYEVNTQEFNNGIYVVTVKNNENILSTKKLVISR